MMAIMYMLGGYLFTSNAAVPREVRRDTSFGWSAQKRLRRAPAQQAVGFGEDTMTFSGILYPCSESGRSGKEQLSLMRAEAKKMQPLGLVDGNGFVYGRWVIKKVSEVRSHLWQNSDPRKIAFTLNLDYYGEDSDVFEDV